MIRIINLNKQFGNQVLFEDTGVAIYENEKIGLIGRNGSGKSTLLKIIQESDPVDCEIELNSNIIVRSLEQKLNFEHNTLLSQVSSKIPNFDDSQTWKAEKILIGLGFSKDDLSKNPKSFSSGFQIRVRLAEALISDCDLLILDEPTNYLDIISLRWLKTFLQNWKKSLILVTHDRKFMQEVVTHTIAIHRRKLRKMSGGPEKLLEQIKLEEQVHEKTRQNQIKKKAKTEEFIRSFRAGARSAGLVQSRIKSLDKQNIDDQLDEIPEIKFKFHFQEYHGNTLIKTEDLSFGYSEDDILIENLSLETLPGDKIAVIGKNGRGKSTLLKILSEQLEPTSGKIKVNHSLSVGYFSQESKEGLHPEKSILEEFVSIPGITEQEARKMCAMLLFRDESVKKKIHYLSGGEQSRVCLGKAILQTSQILILDEPTNHLDLESSQALINAMKQFKGLIIFVSHDEDMITQVANRLIVFDSNQVQLINENYEYFLKNRGWSEESEKITSTLNNSSIEQTQDSPKTGKLIFELKKEQKRIEKEIEKLDSKKIELTQQFNQACLDKDTEKIAELGKAISDLELKIENTIHKLEQNLLQEEALTV